MFTVIVKYTLPGPVPAEKMAEGFAASEERFRNLPQLVRKYYTYDEASHTGHSVYIWENEAAAREFFKPEMLKEFEAKFGATPELTFSHTLMIVDNEHKKTSRY